MSQIEKESEKRIELRKAVAEMSEAQIRIAHLTHPPVRVCAKPRSQGQEV